MLTWTSAIRRLGQRSSIHTVNPLELLTCRWFLGAEKVTTENASRRQFLTGFFRPSRERSDGVASKDHSVASISTENCLAHTGSFCSTCSERCPENGALVVTVGKPRVVAECCTGCGDCILLCPALIPAISRVPYEPPARYVGEAGLPSDRVLERDLPELREGQLDLELLRGWFCDLERHTQCLHLQGRPPRGKPGPTQPLTPGVSLKALLNGTLRAVQARYQYEGVLWMDTVLPEAVVKASESGTKSTTSFRLIRVQPDMLPE
jgi:Fe-S-cluster-containing hydrogenase component 2